MKKLLILSALAATGLAGIATAQTTPPAPPPAPMKHHGMGQDANGDGIITRQEALDAAAKRFDRMDTNHDGKIDATEAQAMRQMRRGGGMRGGYGKDMPPPPPSGTPDGE